MGQHTTSQTFDMSVQANWQALMGFIRTSLLADGCTLTADTGQTDPSGAALPAQNTYAVYEVWKMPNSTALPDIYFKLGYGRNTSNGPSLHCDVGTSTDGAGTVTGDVVNANFPGGATTNGAGPLATFVSAADGYVMICFNPVGEHGFVVIERSVDGTAVPTGDFYTRYIYQNGNGPQQESKNIGGGTQPPSQGSMVTAAPNVWQIGTDVLIALMHPIVRAGLAHQSPNIARWGNVGFTAGAASTVPVYGTNKTYIATTASAGSGHFNLLRYE